MQFVWIFNYVIAERGQLGLWTHGNFSEKTVKPQQKNNLTVSVDS